MSKLSFGYKKRFLRINLTSAEFSIEELKEQIIDNFLGGIGFATWIITKEIDPKVNPLSSKNKLVFAVGPLTGTNTLMTGRHVVAAKSPLTGFWGQSDAGGFWGTELKFAGYDMLIIEGKSDDPVYIEIDNDKISFHDASKIWGKDTYYTEKYLKKVHGARSKILSIGQAGENLVRFASIMNDMGRAAGRRGLGAVMGSKKLKAIVVNGSQKVKVSDPEKIKELNKLMLKKLKEQPGINFLSEGGTGGDLSFLLRTKDLPLKNWMQDNWDSEKAKGISTISMKEKGYFVKHKACFNCPVACEVVVKVDSGKYKVEEQKGPEYETLASLGSLNLITEVEPLIKANELCNKYGMDTIITGSMMAALNELAEKGLLSNKDIKISWGNGDNILEIIEKIAVRRGFGDIIADGPQRIINELGDDAKDSFAIVKNDAIPMHDPRTYIGMGLKYAIGPYGPDHTRADAGFLLYSNPDLEIEQINDPTPFDVARAVVITENFSEVIETMIFCAFAFESWAGKTPPSIIPKFYEAITGIDVTLEDMLNIGANIVKMKRLFNEKIGLSRMDEQLPERFRSVPRFINDQSKTINVDEFLDEYYKIRGWNKPY